MSTTTTNTTTWYQVRDVFGGGCRIEEIEVTKETEHCLIMPDGRRQNKNTDYATSFPTQEEAIDYARKRTQRKIEFLKERIQDWEDSLQKLETDWE